MRAWGTTERGLILDSIGAARVRVRGCGEFRVLGLGVSSG